MIEYSLPIFDVLGQIARSSEYVYSNPLHARIEMFVYDEGLRPIDLTSWTDLLASVPGLQAEIGFGKNTLVLSSGPCRSEETFMEAMSQAFDHLCAQPMSSGWRILFATNPYGRLDRVRSLKNDTLMDGLMSELGEESANLCMSMLSTHATFRIGIGVESIFSSEAKNLLHALANWGPSLGILFDRMTEDGSVTRLRFASFAPGPIRGFRYLTRVFCDDLENELMRIPDLSQKGGGNRAESIWWPARVNPEQSSIETLAFGSMRIPLLLQAMRTVDRLAAFALSALEEDLPILDEKTWGFFKKDFLPCSVVKAKRFLSTFPEGIIPKTENVSKHVLSHDLEPVDV